jgi:lathosterol oxidase
MFDLNVGLDPFLIATMIAGGLLFGQIMVFGLGGLFHVYFFVYKKEQKDDWKIQPKRWPSDEKVKSAIKYSAINLAFGTFTGVPLALYVMNGGWSMLYLNASDLPWVWHVMSFFLTLLLIDAYLYYSHRFLHTPLLYKKYHSVHHRWLDPHIFTTVAMHPVEFMFFQIGLILPMFLIPQWWVIYFAAIAYTFFIGLIDHCGVKIKMPWWTLHGGNNTFHDDHHKFFHTNFGHHTAIWDKLHGTVRQENRQYGEGVFGGKGADKKA